MDASCYIFGFHIGSVINVIVMDKFNTKDRITLIITPTNVLPQHPVNIKELISECFFKYDFSKEQRSSLKMILGSKHVEAILSVLMWNFM